MMENQEILKKLASDALIVQSACNPVGITRSLNLALIELSKMGLGTDAISKHPITRMYLTQLSFLSGMNYDNYSYPEDYKKCEEWSGEIVNN
jgi:hypothetical protein